MFRPAVMHIVGLHSLALEILEGLWWCCQGKRPFGPNQQSTTGICCDWQICISA
jgi:hypothetical protein